MRRTTWRAAAAAAGAAGAAVRGPAVAAAVAAAVAVVAGCGIRTTSVPVDAGPAPSRASCAVAETGRTPAPEAGPTPEAGTTPAPGDGVRDVYLVCGMQATPVPRKLPAPGGPSGPVPGGPVPSGPVPGGVVPYRMSQVRQLVAELQRSPLPAESQAGFTTAVPAALTVTGPAPGDPPDAVRLSQPLDELPSFALAQLVCTLAPLAPGRTVALAGPSGPWHAYACTPDLRTRPAP